MAKKPKSEESTTVQEFSEAPRGAGAGDAPPAEQAPEEPQAPAVPPDLALFGRFVRATGHGVATRYGSPSEQLGLRRDDAGKQYVDTELVVALTVPEAEKYRREYDRQVREGALEDVDGAAYLASLGFDS